MLCQSCADEDVPEDFVSLVKQTPLGRYGADAPMRPGTATITQIPKLVECSPIAALIPQTKVSGEDSPFLPLRPSHLPPTSPSAVYFTGTGEDGCVTLPADGAKALCRKEILI